MKKLKPLLFLCLLSVFAACKKDAATPQPFTPEQEEKAVTDSGSYTVNGKTYTLNSVGNFSVTNTDASLKIDSVVDHVNYYISGNKDSVFFARTYGIANYKDEGYMEISFFKKYSKTETHKDGTGLLYKPNDPTDLFKVGKYNFQVDYTRANANNGVAVSIYKNGRSFITRSLAENTTINQESQNASHFEIISLKHLKYGAYLLEAKFNAVVFDGEEKPHQVTNGYIRMTIP
jgi:hypothetical protein